VNTDNRSNLRFLLKGRCNGNKSAKLAYSAFTPNTRHTGIPKQISMWQRRCMVR